MVGVARSGREPGACAGARQRDTSGGGRGAGTCLQPGLRSPDNTGPSSSCEKSNHLRNEDDDDCSQIDPHINFFVAKLSDF